MEYNYNGKNIYRVKHKYNYKYICNVGLCQLPSGAKIFSDKHEISRYFDEHREYFPMEFIIQEGEYNRFSHQYTWFDTLFPGINGCGMVCYY